MNSQERDFRLQVPILADELELIAHRMLSPDLLPVTIEIRRGEDIFQKAVAARAGAARESEE